MAADYAQDLLLQMDKVSFSYDKRPLLSQIDINVRAGRIIGVAGGNGSGKSTLLKLAAGFLSPAAGTIRRFCLDKRSPVSYCLTPEQIPSWMNARELLLYYRNFFDDFDKRQAEELLDSLKLPQRRSLYRLSTGQTTLLALSLGLSRRAGLYLADEPLSHIEPALRRDIRHFLLKCMPEGSTLMMATHHLDELQYMLDELIILHRHTASQIETEQIRAQYKLSVENYFLEKTKTTGGKENCKEGKDDE